MKINSSLAGLCRNYTNICISMDSIQSNNVLKLDNESFYKSIAKIKHNRQSHEAKKESNQITTQIISWGKLAYKFLVPQSTYYYMPFNF